MPDLTTYFKGELHCVLHIRAAGYTQKSSIFALLAFFLFHPTGNKGSTRSAQFNINQLQQRAWRSHRHGMPGTWSSSACV